MGHFPKAIVLKLCVLNGSFPGKAKSGLYLTQGVPRPDSGLHV